MPPIKNRHYFFERRYLLNGSVKSLFCSGKEVLLHGFKHSWDCRSRLRPRDIPRLGGVTTDHSGLAVLHVSWANLQSERNTFQLPVIEFPTRSVVGLGRTQDNSNATHKG